MKKGELIAFVAEKAGISEQRAERAYDAFWEAILSELKTGHFSLPYGTGTINLREKLGKEIAKSAPVKKSAPAPKAKAPQRKAAVKKSSAKSKPAKAAKKKK